MTAPKVPPPGLGTCEEKGWHYGCRGKVPHAENAMCIYWQLLAAQAPAPPVRQGRLREALWTLLEYTRSLQPPQGCQNKHDIRLAEAESALRSVEEQAAPPSTAEPHVVRDHIQTAYAQCENTQKGEALAHQKRLDKGLGCDCVREG